MPTGLYVAAVIGLWPKAALTKKVPSSSTTPVITGTLWKLPLAKAVDVDVARNFPSTIGSHAGRLPAPLRGGGSAPTRVALAGRLRKQAAICASVPALLQFHGAVNAVPAASDCASVACSLLNPPLCGAALANRPADIGEAIWLNTERPPAEPPVRVTLAGSPPNAAMFCLTQASAAL